MQELSTATDATTIKVVQVLKEMTSDWDSEFSGEIGSNTCLIRDLAFESIDIVQFVVAIEEGFGRRGIPFDQLLMAEGRYVEDLSVGQVANFLNQHL